MLYYIIFNFRIMKWNKVPHHHIIFSKTILDHGVTNCNIFTTCHDKITCCEKIYKLKFFLILSIIFFDVISHDVHVHIPHLYIKA